MSNTYNRRPYYVNIPSDTTGFFVQSKFNGIKTNQNDVEIDQMSFIDAENVYVDEGGALVSRPPFKFSEGETNIVDQWNFGAYTLRLYRLYSFSTRVKGFWNIGTTYTRDDLVVKPGTNDLYMYINHTSTSGNDLTNVMYWTRYVSRQVYVLRCISHDANEYAWSFPETVFGTDRIPKIKCVAIEDKIFIWFAGVDFIVFDLSTLTFEKATKYIYLPICKTVINGIENDLEAANFLTSAYRKRYLYSAISSVNFDKLVGKRMSVYLNGPMTQNTSGYLYDMVVGKNQKNLLVYPYSDVGNYHIETVQVSGAVVTLRYDVATKLIEISFDGMYFRSVPRLEDIVGVPQLSRDGMWLFAFTRTGLAKCRLVAQETLDFEYPERVLGWSTVNYCEHDVAGLVFDATPVSVSSINVGLIPIGYFENADRYSYIIYTDLIDLDGHHLPIFYTQFIGSGASIFGKTLIEPLTHAHAANTPYTLSDGSLQMNVLHTTYDWFKPTYDTAKIFSQYIQEDDAVGRGVLCAIYDNFFGIVWIRVDESSYTRDYISTTYGLNAERFLGNHPFSSNPTISESDLYIDYPLTGTANGVLVTRFIEYRGYLPRIVSYDIGDEVVNYGARYKCVKAVPTSISLPNTDYFTRMSNSKGFYDVSTVYNQGDVVVDSADLREYQYINETSGAGHLLTDSSYWTPGSTRAYYIDTFKYWIGQYFIDSDGFLYVVANDTYFHLSDEEYWTDVISDDTDVYKHQDVLVNFTVGDAAVDTLDAVTAIDASSSAFKLLTNSSTFVTDKYLYIDNEILTLPVDGVLSKTVNDRTILNRDNLLLTFTDGAITRTYDRNIYRLTDDGLYLRGGQIVSGDVVSYTEDAYTESDFLRCYEYPLANNRFIIERIAVTNGAFTVLDGYVRVGDLIRLTSFGAFTLSADNPGNDTGSPINVLSANYVVERLSYSNIYHEPLVVDSTTGDIRFRTPDDGYPIGAIQLFGIAGVNKQIRPLSITDGGATYLIDGTIWTTTLDTMQSNTIELDEYMNCIIDGDDCELETCQDVPDYAVTLDHHYFAYDNKLEATTIKRDSDHNIMLYLPNLNENVFTNRITNLHQLSATDLGVFTEKEIWYVSNPANAPVKSKIPIGCREGNEIITALDGQALLFATPRGLTALAPQDFVATTEPSLKYLNDSIQVKYNPFYNGLVNNAFIAPDGYLPCVKITSYKYWILFYKYMSNEIYVLDTRDGSWWIWTTPYPIKSLYSDSRLHALFEVNYNQNVFNSVRTSMYAVPFIFADHELSSIGYYDDVVKNTISGVTEMITEGDVQRRVSYYASPDIDWHFLSQKLHFDKLNHYKAVKGININVAGDEVITAKMSTRAYRDFYHPESSIVVEIPINDLRTFSQRLNLLHLVNFQYKIENDTNEDTRGHLKLNSLSIKYERKEKIR